MNFENEIKREFDKDMEIPDIVDNRLQDAYQMIQDDVVQMRANSDEIADIHNISHKKKKKAVWFATTAACVVFACTIVFVSNPALAKGIPFIGNIFEQLQEKPNPYVKDKTAYKEIDEHSVKVDAPGNTATDKGITLTVSDAYCDGYDLYIALAVTAEDEEYSSADTFNLLFFEEEDPVPFVANMQVNGMDVSPTSPLQLKKGENDAFIQLLQIPAANLSSLSKNGTAFPDEMDITLTCNGIGVHMAGDNTVYGSFTSEMLSSETVEGNWDLAFHVTVDQSNNEIIDLQAENNGFVLTKAVKTPSNFHLSIVIPSEWVENNPALQIFDSEGNRIELMMGSMTTLEDGSLLEEWTGERTDASEFLVRVIDKNNSTQDNLAVLAEIPFSIEE